MPLAVAGLLDEFLPAAEMARPAAELHAAEQEAGSDQDGGRHVDAHMDSGHVLPQRKEGGIPRHHRLQPATAPRPHRLFVVRHQVSIDRSTFFAPRDAMIARVLAVVVCLSVYLSQASIVSNRLHGLG